MDGWMDGWMDGYIGLMDHSNPSFHVYIGIMGAHRAWSMAPHGLWHRASSMSMVYGTCAKIASSSRHARRLALAGASQPALELLDMRRLASLPPPPPPPCAAPCLRCLSSSACGYACYRAGEAHVYVGFRDGLLPSAARVHILLGLPPPLAVVSFSSFSPDP